MLKPLQDRVLVELDESIPNSAGLIIPIKVDAFRSRDGAVESYNRGRVVAVGPGKRHPKTGVLITMVFSSPQGNRRLQPGDVIRFSELQYHEYKEEGKRYAIITESDVVGVECELLQEAA